MIDQIHDAYEKENRSGRKPSPHLRKQTQSRKEQEQQQVGHHQLSVEQRPVSKEITFICRFMSPL